ncbi:MAG TPA: helix-turn-helix domain-containing protein [Verrucomicrobiota bacterium]|nr:helix-turn-helix domain-containing protein [Verrucomicrobiota bacterium]HNU50595.1 helix-turn-helix domain-containing protein [Verrucomicrobiota bacterium]
MSKQTTISTEAQLRQAAKETLEADDLLRWRWKAFKLNRERGSYAVLELNLDGRRLLFDVEFKLTPSARDLERFGKRGGTRPGLLIAPSLSEVLVQHCRELDLSCADLNGRRWIRADRVVVDRRASEERRYRPRQTVPDVFQSKSSRVARALLSQPDRAWTQGELGERTGLSAGLVSRLVRHLVNEGLVAQDKRVLRLSRASALLDAWAAQDDWEKRTTVRQYSMLEPDVEVVARKLVRTWGAGEALVFTQWFAANLRRPYTIPPLVSVYVARFPGEQIERELRARRVTDGGALRCVVPRDDGVFRETQRVGDFTLACDAQIYLDLLRAGLRGPEQAAALREWDGFGKVTA